ncbi:MAG: hypothetical protein JWN46_2623 [Acidimicrobiales bacterium]|nr:hypothetical protein [Acidimicrobiales bacterium]
MGGADDGPQGAAALAQALGEHLQERGLQIAVAESLTGGMLTGELARAPASSAWLRGGLVAYATEVKHDLLSVRPGPVVSEAAAHDMAVGVARLLEADVAIAVTGVGGPDPQEGQPPGTVWMAVLADGSVTTALGQFEGDPAAVCTATIRVALELAVRRVAGAEAAPDAGADADAGGQVVRHDEAANRFELTVDGHRAELTYRRRGDRLVLDHTGVPGAIEGRGLGSVLVATAVDYARRNDLTIVPVCWFVRTWLDRHPAEAGTVAVATS